MRRLAALMISMLALATSLLTHALTTADGPDDRGRQLAVIRGR
jgi:hypothetical protein